jgi:peroxiredoxin family protein
VHGVRGVTPLAIIVSEPGPRLTTALTLGAAAAALGRTVSILFDGSSVAALAPADPLLIIAIDLGVAVTACQTGLADARLTTADLPTGIVTGGMVGFLTQVGDAQLLLA